MRGSISATDASRIKKLINKAGDLIGRRCFELVKEIYIYHLHSIAHLKYIVSQSEMEMVMHAFISSHLDYCNKLYRCLNKSSQDHLQMVLNVAVRLLNTSPKRLHQFWLSYNVSP